VVLQKLKENNGRYTCSPIKALKLRKIWDVKIFAQIMDQASLEISNVAAMCRAAP
jgi:hypothetical protein